MISFRACSNVVHFLIVTTFLHLCQAKSLGNESSRVMRTNVRIWQPKDGTMSDWLKCHGMPKNMCERTNNKYQHLRETLVQKFGLHSVDNDKDGIVRDTDPNDNSFGGCILLTEEQIDMLMAVAKKSEGATLTRRKKRTMTNLKTNAYSKWPMPVHYKFDGTHDEMQKLTIRNALQHWMDNTCIRFKELATDAPFEDNHILFTGQGYGCYSYVGRTPMKPQPINLHEDCFEAFGTIVHEIGHSLGLWHEQMRGDRDTAIQIIWDNVYEGVLSQFLMADSDALGLAYNYGSVMHYSSKGGSSINGEDTMIALEPLYQMNMGQRTGLSFHDTKIINLAYCQGFCTTPLSQPCLRGGYQNPNSCSACLCPDGFSGQYCEKVAPAKHATCGGVLSLAPGKHQIIKSPGYDDTGYTAHQECNWLIKAPESYAVLLTFDGDFDIYCESGTCFHWVEIKYKRDLGLEGGRFCCNKLPSATIVSESNEMMVIFRSNYSTSNRQRGFHAAVEPMYAPGDRSQNDPDSARIPSTKSTTISTNAVTTAPSIRTLSPVFSQDCERQDLTFLLDSSNTIGSDNWQRTLSFVNSVVAYIGDIGRNKTRVAVTTFGSSAKNVISFVFNNDVSSLRNAISALSYRQMGGKNIAAGLQVVRTQIYAAKRPGVQNTCILVLGGPSSVRASQTLSEAQLMRSRGIRVIVVAVGPVINGTEASGIAGLRDSGVLYASSFSDLPSIVEDTVKKTCRSDKAQTMYEKTLFRCSFENLPSLDSFCGMAQDKTDQFDWKMFPEPTPSKGTGPNLPYDGRHSIYIDARSTTQPNDEARLFFPNLNVTGEVCVDFYYHMFGFHINTLKLVRITESHSSIVWMRSRQNRNDWFHASVGVDLFMTSQLQFIGSRGYGNLGNIALDRINVISGPCAL